LTPKTSWKALPKIKKEGPNQCKKQIIKKNNSKKARYPIEMGFSLFFELKKIKTAWSFNFIREDPLSAFNEKTMFKVWGHWTRPCGK
jgi:hypothetical protein